MMQQRVNPQMQQARQRMLQQPASPPRMPNAPVPQGQQAAQPAPGPGMMAPPAMKQPMQPRQRPLPQQPPRPAMSRPYGA